MEEDAWAQTQVGMGPISPIFYILKEPKVKFDIFYFEKWTVVAWLLHQNTVCSFYWNVFIL